MSILARHVLFVSMISEFKLEPKSTGQVTAGPRDWKSNIIALQLQTSPVGMEKSGSLALCQIASALAQQSMT